MSNNRNLGNIATAITNATSGQVLTSQGNGVATFADAGGGSGVTVYDNTGDLPSSGNTDGDLAWVKDVTGSGALKSLYIWDGSNWRRVSTGLDLGPTVTTEPPTSELNLASTSSVTMVAEDPEGFSVSYSVAYNTTNNVLPDQLSSATTINQTTGEFTFTPSTSASDNGTFKARLTASDGARSTSRFVDFLLDVKASQALVTTGWNLAPGTMWTDQTASNSVATKLFFTRVGTNLTYEYAITNDDISTLTGGPPDNTNHNFTYNFYDAGSVSVDGSKLLCSYNGYIYSYSFSTPFDRSTMSYDGRVYAGNSGHAVSALWYDNGSKLRYQNQYSIYTASATTAYDISTVGSFTTVSASSTYRRTPHQQWAVPSTAEAGNSYDATIADLYYNYWSTSADYGLNLRYGTQSSSNTFALDNGANSLGGSEQPYSAQSNSERAKILFVPPAGDEIWIYSDSSTGNNYTHSGAYRFIARLKLNTAGVLTQLSHVALYPA